MIISHCFTVMVSSQIILRLGRSCARLDKTAMLRRLVVLEHGASWVSGLLFRAHVIPAFFNHNFHEKTKEFCIKTRPTSALHSIEGQVTN